MSTKTQCWSRQDLAVTCADKKASYYEASHAIALHGPGTRTITSTRRQPEPSWPTRSTVCSLCRLQSTIYGPKWADHWQDSAAPHRGTNMPARTDVEHGRHAGVVGSVSGQGGTQVCVMVRIRSNCTAQHSSQTLSQRDEQNQAMQKGPPRSQSNQRQQLGLLQDFGAVQLREPMMS